MAGYLSGYLAAWLVSSGVVLMPHASPSPADEPGVGPLALPPALTISDGSADDVAFAQASDRYWVVGEYLLWWIKNDRVPPLVTTGPATFPVGFLGNPTTVLLFGNSGLEHGTFSGGRFRAGLWLDDCQSCGLEGSYFFLGQRSERREFNSSDFPVLARPFFAPNPEVLGQNSEFIVFPGVSTGHITITSPSSLQGGEVNVRKQCCCGCDYRLDAFGGARYLNLHESLTIEERASVSPTEILFPAFAGDEIAVTDRFATRNQFYGGQLGVDFLLRRNRYFVNLRAQLAAGSTHQEVDIAGSQSITTPAGVTTSFQGGLLALNSNIGHFSRDRFSVVPELGLNVGMQVTPRVQAFIGYNFLYWSDVVRPGDQIDTTLDVTRIPNFGVAATPVGPPRPAVLFKSTDFWAQGINVGLAFDW